MSLRIIQLLALLLMALALVPAGAHLFALPNKIDLAAEPYFIVQGIYRDWALFGAVLFPAAIVDIALAWMLRAQPAASRLALTAGVCVVATLAIFFVWVYPGNFATANWTVVTPDWTALRRDWEYGHAASAVLTFIGFAALAGSVLATRR